MNKQKCFQLEDLFDYIPGVFAITKQPSQSLLYVKHITAEHMYTAFKYNPC